MVRVVVVNFDGGAVTLRCLDALLASHRADLLEIVVVDNASVDGVLWTLREKYPQVRLIVSDTNEGFARGCNLALQDLTGVDHVALINNDAIVQPGWLAPLLAAVEPEGVGAACPKLLLNQWARAVILEAPVVGHLPDGRDVGVAVTSLLVDGQEMLYEARFDERFWADERAHRNDRARRWTKQPTASVWWPAADGAEPCEVEVTLASVGPCTVRVGDGHSGRDVAVTPDGVTVRLLIEDRLRIVNSAGGGLYAGWQGGDRGFLEPDSGQYDEPAEVFSWCGGAVLLKAAYLADVGIFDPTFFLYYEDFDVSWRGRSKGWRHVYEPSSVVLHEHAYSSKEGSAFFSFWVDRNRRLTLVKNAPLGVALRAVGGVGTMFARDLAVHTVAQFRRRRPPSPRWLMHRLRDMAMVLGGLPHAVVERRRISRERTVGHAAIRAWMVTK